MAEAEKQGLSQEEIEKQQRLLQEAKNKALSLNYQSLAIPFLRLLGRTDLADHIQAEKIAAIIGGNKDVSSLLSKWFISNLESLATRISFILTEPQSRENLLMGETKKMFYSSSSFSIENVSGAVLLKALINRLKTDENLKDTKALIYADLDERVEQALQKVVKRGIEGVNQKEYVTVEVSPDLEIQMVFPDKRFVKFELIVRDRNYSFEKEEIERQKREAREDISYLVEDLKAVNIDQRFEKYDASKLANESFEPFPDLNDLQAQELFEALTSNNHEYFLRRKESRNPENVKDPVEKFIILTSDKYEVFLERKHSKWTVKIQLKGKAKWERIEKIARPKAKSYVIDSIEHSSYENPYRFTLDLNSSSGEIVRLAKELQMDVRLLKQYLTLEFTEMLPEELKLVVKLFPENVVIKEEIQTQKPDAQGRMWKMNPVFDSEGVFVRYEYEVWSVNQVKKIILKERRHMTPDNRIISQEMIETWSNQAKQRDEARFPEEVRTSAIFNAEKDTPEEYLSRLKKMFPEEFQQRFIDALWHMARTGHDMPLIMATRLMEGKEVGAKLEEYFPVSLNEMIKELDDKSLDRLRVKVNPDKANEVIVACNLIALSLERLQKEMLDKTIQIFKDLVLGGKNDILNDLPLAAKIHLLQNRALIASVSVLVGKELQEKQIEEALRERITPDYLDTQIPRALQAITYIRDSINTVFDPFRMHYEVIMYTTAAADFGLPLVIPENVYAAVEAELDLRK